MEAWNVEISQFWRKFFQNWPKGLPQRGVLVTSFGEQIVFVSFLVSDEVLLIERQAPDTVGGRKVILPYTKIDALKITDPVKTDVFTSAGFTAATHSK
jgi:hypothetical protein